MTNSWLPLLASARATVVVGLAVSSVLLATVGWASVPLDETPLWHEDAKWLRGHGISIDTSSLVSAALEHPDIFVQMRALTVLTLRGEPEAKTVARELLKVTKEPLLRETAAWSLAQFQDPQGVEVLKNIFESTREVKEKLRIARLLAEFGNTTTWQYIRSAATNEDPEVRQRVANALVTFVDAGQPDSVALLISMAEDPSVAVRKEVVTTIGRVARNRSVGRKLVPLLASLATHDPAAEVRLLADGVLWVWRESESFSPEWLEEEASPARDDHKDAP